MLDPTPLPTAAELLARLRRNPARAERRAGVRHPITCTAAVLDSHAGHARRLVITTRDLSTTGLGFDAPVAFPTDHLVVLDLASQGVTVAWDSELVALISYLQRLGRDVGVAPPATAAPVAAVPGEAR